MKIGTSSMQKKKNPSNVNLLCNLSFRSSNLFKSFVCKWHKCQFFPFLSSSTSAVRGVVHFVPKTIGSKTVVQYKTLLVRLQQFLVEEQVCLRVEYPWLWYCMDSSITDVDPLALGTAAGVPRTWNIKTHSESSCEKVARFASVVLNDWKLHVYNCIL